MFSSTRARLGAVVAAGAVIAGSLLAAAPANAATGQLTLANATFTAGNWGTGLDVSGTGFTADAVITISVTNTEDDSVLGTQDVTADGSGAFANEVFTPTGALVVPAEDSDIVVTATSADDTSNTVVLDVRAPKGISANTTSITTKDLMDPEAGVSIVASGYTPGETVTLTGVYNGDALDGSLEVTADRNGTVSVENVYIYGYAEAGTLVFTLTGEDSDVDNSITITVTGPTIGGPGDGGIDVPNATPLPAPAPNLPIVSG